MSSKAQEFSKEKKNDVVTLEKTLNFIEIVDEIKSSVFWRKRKTFLNISNLTIFRLLKKCSQMFSRQKKKDVISLAQ